MLQRIIMSGDFLPFDITTSRSLTKQFRFMMNYLCVVRSGDLVS